MINIDYSNGKIRVETKKISTLFNLPLKLSIQSHVSGKEVWQSQLNDEWWAEYPNNEINDVEITDSKNNIILKKRWNIFNDGNYLYKSLYLYCQSLIDQNKKPQGLAIGTHDGLFGEWVPCVLDNITDAILVEASIPQFEKLKLNYNNINNITLIQSLVTTDGQPVEFFEGGKGYTNSVIERVIKGWEKEEIKSTIKESISISSLITKPIDWIHTDVEGYDAKLLKAIPKELLPNLIIFEHENLEKDENEELKDYLLSNRYNLNYQDVSCICFKII